MATALREILAKFGFEVDSSKLDKAKKDTDSLVKTFKKVASVFAGAAIVSGVKAFVNEMVDAATQIQRTSQQLGLGAHELQRWQTAADMAGVDVESLATGIKFLQKNASEAAEKGGDAAAVFKKLGVTVKDASGNVRPTGELLRDTGLAIGAIQNPAQRTAEVLKVFGRQGLSLIPMFNKGAEGLDELLGELDRLGGGISDDAINKLLATRKAGKQLDVAILSLKSAISVKLVPAVTALTNFGTRIVQFFTKAEKGSEILKGAFIALTAAIIAGNAQILWSTLATAGKFILAWLPVIAIIVLAALAIDDFLTFMKGGKSVIGDFFEAILGAETMARVRSGGEGLGHAFGMAIWRGLKRAATFIVDLIGTIFTGGALVGVGGPASEGEKMGAAFVDAIINGAKAAINAAAGAIGLGALFDTKHVPGVGGGSAPPPEPTGSAPAGAKQIYNAQGQLVDADFSKREYGPTFAPKAASAPYAPSASVGNSYRGHGPIQVSQQNNINVPITTTGDPGQVSPAARNGINGALNDQRRGILHALEPVADGGGTF